VADRALITGGAGFIGYHLARRLLSDGWDVVLVDDLSRGKLDAGLQCLLDDARFVQHDLRAPLSGASLGEGYRAVFHLAGVVGVARTQRDPGSVLRTNIVVTMNVLEWCSAFVPEVVFFSSTSEVADGAVTSGMSTVPVAESVPAVFCEPGNPRTAYGVSKLCCELLVRHQAAQAGFRARIGRYFNVYGPRMGHSHVVPELIGRITGGQNPLVVYGADQSRAFCHVTDAVEGTVRFVGSPGAEAVVANIGNDEEETTIANLAHQLAELAGVEVDIEPGPAPPGSPERRLPDLSMLKRLTGYAPTVTLVDGLRDCLSWYAPTLRSR
jgi:UDP-glucuronate decarboxylase